MRTFKVMGKKYKAVDGGIAYRVLGIRTYWRRLNRKCMVATGGFGFLQTTGLFTLSILAALWLCGMLPIVQ